LLSGLHTGYNYLTAVHVTLQSYLRLIRQIHEPVQPEVDTPTGCHGYCEERGE
jgi:hypothetical protein